MRTCEAGASAGVVVLKFRNRRRTASSALALLVLGVLGGLVPLAHASPPDPTWIAGFYDDADFDDVVLAIISAHVVLSPTAPAIALPEACAHRLAPGRRILPDDRPLLTTSRSPPLPPA